jgi:ABC-type proline/glycine betaine transport system permease subunit
MSNMGCVTCVPRWRKWSSKWERRRHGRAKLPLAFPVIMLGINQTFMAVLSALAIAELVGACDLGQQVYVALGNADAGHGW